MTCAVEGGTRLLLEREHALGKKLDIASHCCHLSGTLSRAGNRPEVMERGVQVQFFPSFTRIWFEFHEIEFLFVPDSLTTRPRN